MNIQIDCYGKENWYITNDIISNGMSWYLHSDLKWRQGCYDGEPLGYYDTRQKAEAVLHKYRLGLNYFEA